MEEEPPQGSLFPEAVLFLKSSDAPTKSKKTPNSFRSKETSIAADIHAARPAVMQPQMEAGITACQQIILFLM